MTALRTQELLYRSLPVCSIMLPLAASAGSVEPSRSGRTVIWIEDDEFITGYGRLLFAEAGWRLSLARTGTEGLRLAEEVQADVILLDLKLPDLSGLAVLERLSSIRPGIPVVVLTSYPDEESRAAAEHLGAAAYCVKPISGSQLLDVLTRAINRPQVVPHLKEPTAEEVRLAGLSLPGPDVSHPVAVRLAESIAAVRQCRDDPRTIPHWARSVGLSSSALRARCQALDVRPKNALALARGLRAVWLAAQRAEQPADLIDIVDPRTLSHFIAAGCLGDPIADDPYEAVVQYCTRQRFVGQALVVQELVRMISGGQ